MRAPLLLAGLLALSAPAAEAARALTLDEAWALALRRSEEVAIAGETWESAREQIAIIRGSVMPQVSLDAAQHWQDEARGSSIPQPTSQPTVSIGASQPIFSGLREYLAVRRAKSLTRAAELSLRRAEQRLYEDAAAAYLDLWRARRELAIRSAQSELTEDRIKELRGFLSIGRSRRSELLAAESLQAQNRAQLEAAAGRERVAQAVLRFLTGVEDELEPSDFPAPSAEPAESYLRRAQSRPDVEAARAELEAAELSVSLERRRHWPQISATGNYYLKRPATILRNVRWDATLSGSLPLFSGGAILAQTRQARSAAEARGQALSSASRRARLEALSAHADLESGLSMAAALEKAASLAEANAKAQAADYRNGLVTNLDVLNSLSAAQDTRLRLEDARASAALARARLEVAAGGPSVPGR